MSNKGGQSLSFNYWQYSCQYSLIGCFPSLWLWHIVGSWSAHDHVDGSWSWPINTAQGFFNRAATQTSSLHPACVQGLPPSQRQGICPHWISKGSCWPVIPACPGPSKQQPNPHEHLLHFEYDIICKLDKSPPPQLLCITDKNAKPQHSPGQKSVVFFLLVQVNCDLLTTTLSVQPCNQYFYLSRHPSI